ncbi:MAG: TRAP transporter large permease subunit [Nitrospira sp.]|nr:TRAP transporter large permease subunit [Nitrospira sp.]
MIKWGQQLSLVSRLEPALAGLLLLLMAILPVVELALRAVLNAGIPAASSYVQSLTLWVGFTGAMLAAREDQHLSFFFGRDLLPAGVRPYAEALTACVSTVMAAGLCWASYQFVRADLQSPVVVGGWLPTWMVESILPLSFAVMAVRFAMKPKGMGGRVAVVFAVLATVAARILAPTFLPELVGVGVFVLLLAAAVGSPIFIVVGGITLLLFEAEGTTAAAIPVETYRLVVSPSIPAIPLFTLAGYVLAEGGASRRLVRLFRAWFGWLPGGLAVVVTALCAFLTTFTGASGVTILAVGGLMLPILINSGYRKGFAIGLLTSTGSIGLLFPPSLAVILYGVVAHVSILDLFKAGILPGLLLVTVVSGLGIREAWRYPESRLPFAMREALAALWEAKWELMTPVLVLGSLFGGYGTLIETAAMTAVYSLVVEVIIHRELTLWDGVPAVVTKCVILLGGVFAILGVGLGLANYLVDAEVPMNAADWFQHHIESKVVFLIVLNGFLILVGCLLDIFSAITIVVPLIQPISQLFGVDPLHLAMIFLLNMQLGYVTPPVGLDLFFASYRFGVPLSEVFRHTLPFFLAMALVLLLVTYVPWLALALV